MAKYDPLSAYLQALPGNSCALTFGAVEEIIGTRLPRSAGEYREWWSNEADSPTSHVQARSWIHAGWKVESVRLDARQVRFVKDVRVR